MRLIQNGNFDSLENFKNSKGITLKVRRRGRKYVILLIDENTGSFAEIIGNESKDISDYKDTAQNLVFAFAYSIYRATPRVSGFIDRDMLNSPSYLLGGRYRLYFSFNQKVNGTAVPESGAYIEKDSNLYLLRDIASYLAQ